MALLRLDTVIVPLVGALAFAAVLGYNAGVHHLQPLLVRSVHTDVIFPTGELEGGKFWVTFLYFIVRSLVRRVGLNRGSNPIISTDTNGQTTYQLPGPTTSLSMPFRVTSKDLKQYNRAIGVHDTEHPESVLENDLHLSLLLSALTEPAMLLLLAKINCPIDPVGAVNVRNRFELLDSAQCRKLFRENTTFPDLVVFAELGRNAKKVKRGWEYSLVVSLRSDTGIIYRQIFTMLEFTRHKTPVPTSNISAVSTTPLARFSLASSAPLSWARLSKDYNPIHLSVMAAKLLGFSAKIAHGNHVVANAVQAVLGQDKSTPPARHLEVQFRRPVVVPIECEVRQSADEGDGRYLEIWFKDKFMTTVKYGSTIRQ